MEFPGAAGSGEREVRAREAKGRAGMVRTCQSGDRDICRVNWGLREDLGVYGAQKSPRSPNPPGSFVIRVRHGDLRQSDLHDNFAASGAV